MSKIPAGLLTVGLSEFIIATKYYIYMKNNWLVLLMLLLCLCEMGFSKGEDQKKANGGHYLGMN